MFGQDLVRRNDCSRDEENCEEEGENAAKNWRFNSEEECEECGGEEKHANA
jgi:hypothetical protein